MIFKPQKPFFNNASPASAGKHTNFTKMDPFGAPTPRRACFFHFFSLKTLKMMPWRRKFAPKQPISSGNQEIQACPAPGGGNAQNQDFLKNPTDWTDPTDPDTFSPGSFRLAAIG